MTNEAQLRIYTNMENADAIDAFLALGQDTRLAAYRLLVEHEPHGLPAGEIADRLAVNPSTLSRHLAQLERAGLLRSRRDQRQIIYGIDHEGTDRLIRFVTEDCCTASRPRKRRSPSSQTVTTAPV